MKYEVPMIDPPPGLLLQWRIPFTPRDAFYIRNSLQTTQDCKVSFCLSLHQLHYSDHNHCENVRRLLVYPFVPSFVLCSMPLYHVYMHRPCLQGFRCV